MVNTLKENQQRLILSERRAAIGEIAAGISHELNNPIGVICGFTEFLLKRRRLQRQIESLLRILTMRHRDAKVIAPAS